MENEPHPLSGLILRAKLRWTLFMSAFVSAAWIGLAVWAFELVKDPSAGGWVMWSTVGIGFALLFTWAAVEFWVGYVEFSDSGIYSKSLFSGKRFTWEEVTSFRGRISEGSKSLSLLDREGKTLVNLPSHLGDVVRVETWAAENLVDAQEFYAQRELEEISKEAQLEGIDFDARLSQARNWTRALNVAAFVVCLPGVWLFFKDESPEFTLVVGALLALMPVLAMMQAALFGDVVRLIQWRGSKLPTATVTLFSPLVLALVMLKDNVLDWEALGWWCGAALLVLLCAYALFDRGVRRHPVSLLVLTFFALFNAVGMVLGANALLDFSDPRLEPVKVIETRAAMGSGKDVRMHYKVEVLRADGSKDTIEVDEATLGRLKPGKKATLKVRAGWLGIPWVKHDDAFEPPPPR